MKRSGQLCAAYLIEVFEPLHLLTDVASLIADINRTAASSSPSVAVDVGGIAYFAASNGANGSELWKSDGTTAGTLFQDINVGPGSASPGSYSLGRSGLFFAADDAITGIELWGIPAAGVPVAPDLLASFDTGVSPSDKFTRLNNSSQATRLALHISGTVPGAAVKLFADGRLIGSATASGSVTTIDLFGRYWCIERRFSCVHCESDSSRRKPV